MLGFVGLSLAIWFGAIAAWWLVSKHAKGSNADRIRNRLLGVDVKAKQASKQSGKVALFEDAETPKGKLIPRLLAKYNLNTRVQALIEQAGLKIDPIKFVHLCMGAFILGYVTAVMLLPDSFRPYGLLIAAVASTLPVFHIMRKRKARLRAFEEVFPDALEFISRSMRAGHAFSVALEMIHREFRDPLATEFRRTFEEHNLGLPLDVALLGLTRRIPLLDVHFFVSAVLLQKRTGGNLAEILDKLAYVIRERFKLRGKIRAISAHGRMTGIALTSIPAAVGVIMFYTNPTYVRFFFDDVTGNYMIGAAIALQVVGYLAIRKIVTIEV